MTGIVASLVPILSASEGSEGTSSIIVLAVLLAMIAAGFLWLLRERRKLHEAQASDRYR